MAGSFPTASVNGSLVLSGPTSTSGPLTIHPGRSLNVGGQSLAVGGTLTVGASTASQSHLVMSNPQDSLHVKGSFNVQAHTALSAGVVVVEGDVSQGTVANALDPSGTRFVFAGTGTQTVTFNNPGSSFLRNAQIQNTGGGVTFASHVYVLGVLQLVPSATVRQATNLITYYNTSFPRITGATYDVPNTYVNASFTMDEDFALPTASHHLVISPTRTLTLGGHTLSVGGNLTVGAPTASRSHLVMASASDSLRGGGHFSVQANTQLDDGVLVLEGNLTQGTVAGSLDPAGTRILLAEPDTQSVAFNNVGTSFLRNAEIASGAHVQMNSHGHVAGDLYVKGWLRVPSARQFTVVGTLFLRSSGEIQNDGTMTVGLYESEGGTFTGSATTRVAREVAQGGVRPSPIGGGSRTPYVPRPLGNGGR